MALNINHSHALLALDRFKDSWFLCIWRGRRGRMVVGFTTTYAISTYHQVVGCTRYNIM